ncbi:MAG: two-component system chemotaxis response regulator CheB [Myxococcota bacterium]|jgi:two-component system chemotaxis response regulator CheB
MNTLLAAAHDVRPDAAKTIVLSCNAQWRDRLTRILEADGQAIIVCEASSAETVFTYLKNNVVDAIVVDPHALRERSSETIRAWTRQDPVAVIVASHDPVTAVEALSAGAIIATPTPDSDDLGSPKAHQLRKAVATALTSRAVYRPPTSLHTLPDLPFTRAEQRTIAIVAGIGGAASLESLIAHLPPSVPGIVAMLDIHPAWLDALAKRLDRVGVLDVTVGSNGDYLRPGTVCLTPTDRQVTVSRSSDGQFILRVGERLTAPPSPEAFLRSIGANARSSALGVLLGTHDEGAARGLRIVAENGGRILVEDPETAVASSAGALALREGIVSEATELRRLPWRILEEALTSVFEK